MGVPHIALLYGMSVPDIVTAIRYVSTGHRTAIRPLSTVIRYRITAIRYASTGPRSGIRYGSTHLYGSDELVVGHGVGRSLVAA
eukprot:2315069-Rhodomonas_salina.1